MCRPGARTQAPVHVPTRFRDNHVPRNRPVHRKWLCIRWLVGLGG